MHRIFPFLHLLHTFGPSILDFTATKFGVVDTDNGAFSDALYRPFMVLIAEYILFDPLFCLNQHRLRADSPRDRNYNHCFE